MNILILASQNSLYLPLEEWVINEKVDNFYTLFIRKEHEESYEKISDYSNVNIYSFENWESNNSIEIQAIKLHENNKFDKLLSVREGDVERAALLREYLNIHGQRPVSAGIFRNKYKMKKIVSENGFKTPRVQLVNHYLDVLRFIDINDYPVVIKPIAGAGSVNTHVIKCKEDLDVFAIKNSFSNMIVESFAVGGVFHIDGLILDNKLEIITVSKYINDCLSYQEGKSTASIFLNQESELSTKLKNYTKTLLNILPCSSNMTFHLEVFVNEEDIIFCEIACRTGGGRIAECIEAELGIHITKALLRHECGLVTNLESSEKNWYKYRGWILSSPLKGKLMSLPDKVPFDWVFDYWKFAKVGSDFNGANSSVFSTAALSCEGDSEEEVINRLLEIDNWYKSQSIYQ